MSLDKLKTFQLFEEGKYEKPLLKVVGCVVLVVGVVVLYKRLTRDSKELPKEENERKNDSVSNDLLIEMKKTNETMQAILRQNKTMDNLAEQLREIQIERAEEKKEKERLLREENEALKKSGENEATHSFIGFKDKLTIEYGVCRIEVNKKAKGTGVLMHWQGNLCVLTNNHVIPEGSKAKSRARFMFHDENDIGTSFFVELNYKKIFATSPEDELDYTLISIDKTTVYEGLKRVIDERKQQNEPWDDNQTDDIVQKFNKKYGLTKPSTPFILRQYPNKYYFHSPGSIVRREEKTFDGKTYTFIKHNANSHGGSSGGPMYSGDTLIAIHHKGADAAQEKRAIWIGSIIEHLNTYHVRVERTIENHELFGEVKYIGQSPDGDQLTGYGVGKFGGNKKFRGRWEGGNPIHGEYYEGNTLVSTGYIMDDGSYEDCDGLKSGCTLCIGYRKWMIMNPGIG